MRGGIVVLIENTYACGQESEHRYTVREPSDGEGIDDWWEEAVAPLTGDGHACGLLEDALYEATVVAAPGRLDLIGQTTSWSG